MVIKRKPQESSRLLRLQTNTISVITLMAFQANSETNQSILFRLNFQRLFRGFVYTQYLQM